MKKQISATGPWEGNSLGRETNTRERQTESERERETAQFYLVSLQRNTMMHIFIHETSRSRHKALTTLCRLKNHCGMLSGGYRHENVLTASE